MEESIKTNQEDLKPNYDELIHNHLETREQNYLPLVFIAVILAILIIGAVFLFSRNNTVNTNVPDNQPLSTTSTSTATVSFPQSTNLQNLATPNPTPTQQPNTVVMVDYTITNNDGNTVKLKYPSDWTVKTFNNNSTYAFISPNGSALGYDFA